MKIAPKRGLIALVALCVLSVSAAYQQSQPYRVDLSSARDVLLLEGFYPPELSGAGVFRWTGGRADVRFPNLWAAQPVRLSLVLSAPQTTPATLAVNGRQVASLALSANARRYDFELDADTLGASGNLYLTLNAPTDTPPNDLRALGVIVSAVEVTPLAAPPFVPSLSVLLALSASVALSYVWLRQLGVGATPAFVIGLALIAGATLALVVARPLIALFNARILFWLLVVFALSELTTWLGRYRQHTRAYRLTALLFLVAFGVRLLLAHAPGDFANFVAFKMMIAQIVQHGLASIYELDPVVGAYPPVHHYDLALIGFLYRTFVSPEFDVDSLRLNFMMKLPTIVLDMLIAVVVMVYAARRRDTRTALACGAAYALNPGIIYTSAYNGQLGDPLYTLFVALAVTALLTEQAALLGAATALAVLTKPQASAFLPLLVLAGWRFFPQRAERIRALVAGGIVSALVLLPFTLAGTLGDMLRTVSSTIGHGPRISSNAFNVWWLLGWGQAWDIKDTELLLGVPYRTIGLLLFFGVAYGLVAWQLWRARERTQVAPLAAFVALAFFMLPTEIHENYLFPTFPLLLLAAVHMRRAWWAYALLTLTWFVNLIFVDTDLINALSDALPALASLLFPIQVLMALVNVGVLLAWTATLLRGERRWSLRVKAASAVEG